MKYLLRFDSEADMLSQLQAAGAAAPGDSGLAVLPISPIGTLIVRGILGTPGVYVPSGTSESGEPVYDEVEPPTVWPGYHAELYAESVPESLAGRVVTSSSTPDRTFGG